MVVTDHETKMEKLKLKIFNNMNSRGNTHSESNTWVHHKPNCVHIYGATMALVVSTTGNNPLGDLIHCYLSISTKAQSKITLLNVSTLEGLFVVVFFRGCISNREKKMKQENNIGVAK